MNELFTQEGLGTIGAECLCILQDSEYNTFKSTGVVDIGDSISVEMFSDLGVLDGVKHFDISFDITEKEKQLDFELFSNTIIMPAITAISEKLSYLKGEYNSINLHESKDGLSRVVSHGGMSIRVTYAFDPKYARSLMSIDCMVVEKKIPKVFLGGTCNDSPWRDALIDELDKSKIDYFNPVVSDWTPECMKEEEIQRGECDYCLYVITPKMTGCYSIAEATFDSVVSPEKTMFCVCEFDVDGEDTITYEPHMVKSLEQTSKLIGTFGAMTFKTLQDVVDFLNK